MAANIQYGLKWQFSIVALGVGQNSMTVPSAQALTISQATAYPGSTPSGIIAITSTGSYPTSGNITTALSAAATAAGLIYNAAPANAQWQGFATAGG